MSQSTSSMAAPPEESTTDNTYELHCNDCSFQTSVEGGCYEALEAADAHQEACEGPAANHFVDFILVE